MPIYEYKCTKCGSVFEVLQKVNDPQIKNCIHCKSPVKKLISPPAIQFKGTGWYVTDYASKGAQPPQSKPVETPKKETGTSTEKKNTPSSTSSSSEKS